MKHRWSQWGVAFIAMLVLAACQPAAPAPAAAPKEAAKQEPPTAAAPKAAAPKEQAAQPPAAKAAEGGPIRIGLIAERTGPLAMHGEASMRSVELYAEEINAKGGILGRKLEILTRDSKSQQDEAARHARDLLITEKVDFLLHGINSAECLAISDVAKEAKRIVLSSCGIDDFTSSKGNRYAFRVPNINSRTQGQAAAKYMADRMQSAKTIYTISNDYSFGRSVVDFFKGKLKALNPSVQFVGESWPKFGETDYTPFITAVQNQRADATFYFFAVAIPFFNQAAPVNLQKQTPLVSAYWGGVDDIAALKQEAVPEGAIMGGYPWYGIDSQQNKDFVEKFRAKYNQAPRGAAYFQYMTMQFLNEAIKRAGTTETEKVINALEGLEVETVVGKSSIRAFDHQGATPHWVGKAKWDPQLKMGVLADFVKLDSAEFLPSEAEIKQQRGS